MSTMYPHVNQVDRDVIEDLGLMHENAGSGEHAQHHEEGTPA